jgi:Rrf2 family iron-sulfur cluster assembly transcriptional regulator
MKLSTRSRYGLRMLLDMALHCHEGPVQIGSIAKRQDISVKYLEQLIIPLKKAHYINSVRGPKGGHLLAKPADQITVGKIVKLLEGGIDLCDCIGDPDCCDRHDNCPTRSIWKEATEAMYHNLDAITLSKLIECRKGRTVGQQAGEKRA